MGPYRVIRLLGEGAFARTSLCEDTRSGAHVAVKELTLKDLPDWKPVEQFEREAAVLRSISHPNIVGLVDAFDEQDGDTLRLYLVTTFVEGPSLAQAIATGRRWSEEDATALLRSLLEILQYLHGLSPPVVHRDIKPGNIILHEDGTPVLIDFGAVRDLAAGGSRLTVLGTPGYMAPEQALGQADARSDLYGLGATLIHALSHCAPAELPRDGMRLRFRDRIGDAAVLADVLERMVEADPAKRLSSAKRGLELLEAADAPEGSAALALRDGAALPALLSAKSRPDTRAITRQFTRRALVEKDPKTLVAALLVPIATIGISGAAGAAVGLVGAIGVWVATSLGAVGLFLRLGRRARRHRELYASGVYTQGRVTHAAGTSGYIGIEYEYIVDGSTFHGSFHSQSPMVAAALRPNLPIAVFYDPEQPKDHFATFDPGRVGT